MDVQIPEKFDDILKRNQKLHGAVMLSVTEFEPWLRLSGTPFFPEYTDHGPKHLSDTLATSSGIIRDEAWSAITSADIAVLTLAVLLHDCAMHLSEDGFVALVKPGTGRATIEVLGDASWTSLWVDFLGEASRFDARKLFALFGDTEPARNPGSDPKAWTTRDKLLIGEFLRRHHARLAHEVAIWGVPTSADKPLRLKETPEDIADIAGLVARSHGQPIRSCFPYLLKRYDIREYKGIHSVFLMTVVRIADYLQVQSDRAPEQVLRVRQLRSPISRGEWKAHDSVRDIRSTHEDPEAIFVDAAPKEVRTYLKLKNLLEGIQDELDGSWAVLGEVYGRYDKLNQLGLGLRRIRSNLDDGQAFAASVPYVPCRAAFEAADADLLNLLIEPLYGHRPEIGIRELVQNAVDACRELRDHFDQRPNLPALDLPVQDADVVVTLEEGEENHTGWLEVADQGIGMTADVIHNYFLKAGASFRRSDSWRRSHEDESGKSRVLRSGRFGIGVLASFLLGDQVEVSTRNVDASPDEGISFKASIDSSEIELRRCSRPVGTTIRIRISREEIWKSLSQSGYDWPEGRKTGPAAWDWYCLSDPKVVRRFKRNKGPQESLKQLFSLPLPKSSMPESWHQISHPDYSEIHWTYRKIPRLTCNGIKVVEPSASEWDYYYTRDPIHGLWETYRLTLLCPNVSVFDPDGHLPLLLQRTGPATPKYPFHENLLSDVVKDLLAFVLVNAPEGPITQASSAESYSKFYPGFATRDCKWLILFSLPEGSSIVDPWHLQSKDVKRFDRALLVPLLREMPSSLSATDYSVPDLIIPFKAQYGPQDSRAWLRSVLGGTTDYYFGPAMGLKRKGCRLLMREKTLKEFKQPGLIAQYYWSVIEEESCPNGWIVLRSGDCTGPSLNFQKLAASTAGGIEGLAEWYLSQDQPETKDLSPIAKSWMEIVGAPIIPFDVEERRTKLHRAYDLLKNYIAVHEKVKEEAKKRRGRAAMLDGDV
jgi:molecular chaperone HtpG